MSRTECFHKINQLIKRQLRISFAELQSSPGISCVTLTRLLEYMRNRLNVPILYDHKAEGYRFDSARPAIGGQYECRACGLPRSLVEAVEFFSWRSSGEPCALDNSANVS